MECIRHEAYQIADSVKRTYRCQKCDAIRAVFIDVCTFEMREASHI